MPFAATGGQGARHRRTVLPALRIRPCETGRRVDPASREKRPERIQERLGRLKQRSFGVGQHYTNTVETNPENTRVTGLAWTKDPKLGSMLTTPGVYCLRSTERDWSEERFRCWPISAFN